MESYGRLRPSKQLGTFGSMANFELSQTKNLTCGEGGALLAEVQKIFNTE